MIHQYDDKHTYVMAGRMVHLHRDDPKGIPLCGAWKNYAARDQVGPLMKNSAWSRATHLTPTYATQEQVDRYHLCKTCEKMAKGEKLFVARGAQ